MSHILTTLPTETYKIVSFQHREDGTIRPLRSTDREVYSRSMSMTIKKTEVFYSPASISTRETRGAWDIPATDSAPLPAIHLMSLMSTSSELGTLFPKGSWTHISVQMVGKRMTIDRGENHEEKYIDSLTVSDDTRKRVVVDPSDSHVARSLIDSFGIERFIPNNCGGQSFGDSRSDYRVYVLLKLSKRLSFFSFEGRI